MKEINVLDYSTEILNNLKKGILLTSINEDKVNTMAISWGTLGIQWNKPIFIAYVRENRYTRECIDKHLEFTVNVPISEIDKNIIKVTGSKSGLHTDKVKELNLTLVPGKEISVPAIKELPLTLECKVIYKQLQDKNAITPYNQSRFYPDNVDSDFPGSNKDYHIAYYGEIVSAYIL